MRIHANHYRCRTGISTIRGAKESQEALVNRWIKRHDFSVVNIDYLKDFTYRSPFLALRLPVGPAPLLRGCTISNLLTLVITLILLVYRP